jgi:hypothetical protein
MATPFVLLLLPSLFWCCYSKESCCRHLLRNKTTKKGKDSYRCHFLVTSPLKVTKTIVFFFFATTELQKFLSAKKKVPTTVAIAFFTATEPKKKKATMAIVVTFFTAMKANKKKAMVALPSPSLLQQNRKQESDDSFAIVTFFVLTK